MTASSHVIAGCCIALAIPVPAIALPLAFVSHFVMDAIPHYGGDDHTPIGSRRYNLMLGGDMACAALVLVAVTLSQPAHWPWVVLAGVVAASPDVTWLPTFIRSVMHRVPRPRNWFMRFHAWVQWCERPRLAVLEIIWLVASVCVLAVFLDNSRIVH